MSELSPVVAPQVASYTDCLSGTASEGRAFLRVISQEGKSIHRAAGPLDSELGALMWAPSSTPTPRRSTSSPPSQPVTAPSSTPAKLSTRAGTVGTQSVVVRSHQ